MNETHRRRLSEEEDEEVRQRQERLDKLYNDRSAKAMMDMAETIASTVRAAGGNSTG